MGRPTLYWDIFAKWAVDAVKFSGIKQAELARRLTRRLKRGIDAAAINKILKGGRALAADEMLAIAEITNYPVLISLEGETLDKGTAQFNEDYLVKLFSFALEWRGLAPDSARNLSAALLAAARKRPDRQGIETTDDQLKEVALALAAVLGLPPQPQ